MTYIPSAGSAAAFNPVPFDANDLFCWQTIEGATDISWPNRVPGGATATLTRSATDANRRAGGSPAVNLSTEFSFICTASHYPSETASGASANVGPNNDFTVDLYLYITGRQETSPQSHWVWRKLRRAHSNVADDCSIGMYINYSTLAAGSSLDLIHRARLTSGNVIEIGGSIWPPGYLSPQVWHHVGFTLATSGGNTVMTTFIDGERTYGGTSAVGTAVDWSTSFPWNLGGFYNGTAAFSHAQCRIQRLRVSNIVRPQSYFIEAFKAIQ